MSKDEDWEWLEALIWPEHADRRALFNEATKKMDLSQIELLEGDGIKMEPAKHPYSKSGKME